MVIRDNPPALRASPLLGGTRRSRGGSNKKCSPLKAAWYYDLYRSVEPKSYIEYTLFACNLVLPMLTLVCHEAETGDKDNRHEPEEEPEPVYRIPVRDRQKFDRPARYKLGREDADYKRGHNAERQKYFLPEIHAVLIPLLSRE